MLHGSAFCIFLVFLVWNVTPWPFFSARTWAMTSNWKSKSTTPCRRRAQPAEQQASSDRSGAWDRFPTRQSSCWRVTRSWRWSTWTRASRRTIWKRVSESVGDRLFEDNAWRPHRSRRHVSPMLTHLTTRATFVADINLSWTQKSVSEKIRIPRLRAPLP